MTTWRTPGASPSIGGGIQIMVAALREVGIDATAADDAGVNLDGHDPRLYWRAANIAREAIGLGEWPWDEWCEWHRRKGPQTAAWLDKWGCP